MSHENSITETFDDGIFNISTVDDNGRQLTREDARKRRKVLEGPFNTIEEAVASAEKRSESFSSGLSESEELEFLTLKRKRASVGAEQPSITNRIAATESVGIDQQESIPRIILDQALQGATFGFADELTDRLGAAIAAVSTGQNFDVLLNEARTLTKERQQRQFKQQPVISIAANIAGGLLTGGAVATTKTGAALATSLRTGRTTTRIVKAVPVGAVSGAAFGAGTAEEGERLEAARTGAIFGGTIAGAIPVVAATARGIKATVIPRIDEASKPLIQRARDFGIPLRADQVSPTRARKTVQKISQEIPFSGADQFEATQRIAFNKAVARTLGQEADDLGPDTIRKFLNDASRKFDAALVDETITFSDDVIKKIANLSDEAEKTVSADLANVIRKNVDQVLSDIGDGTISGEKLSSVRSQLIKRTASAQPGAKQLLSELIEEIDDVVQVSVSKEKREILKTARREWRNFKTIEPLLEKAEEGLINPTELLNRVKASKFIKASRIKTGTDDLVDLARIGKRFLPKAGGSDTFQKSALGAGTVGLIATTVANPLLGLSLATKAGVGIAANRGLQNIATNQRLIDAALRSPKSAGKELSAPLTGLIAGQQSARSK